MKISKQRLLEALNAVQPGLSNKAIVEQSDSFIFTKGQLLTYNDKICVSYPLKTELDCALSGKEFYGIISGCPEDEVTLEQKKDSVSIKSGKDKSQLQQLDSSSIMELVKSLKLLSVKKKLQPLPDDFVEAINFCLFTASKDATYPVLTCLYINKNVVMSSDDFRVTKFEMKEGLESSFLLPATAAEKLVRYDVDSYYAAEDWIYFKTTNNAMFCSRAMQGEYPDYSQDFDVKGTNLIFPNGLSKCVQDSIVMTDGDFDLDKRVQVTLDSGSVIVRAEKEGIGWTEKPVEMKYKGKKKSFVINPKFFAAILQRSNKAKLGEDRVVFTSKNSQHLISLFVDDEQEAE